MSCCDIAAFVPLFGIIGNSRELQSVTWVLKFSGIGEAHSTKVFYQSFTESNTEFSLNLGNLCHISICCRLGCLILFRRVH